MQKIIIDTNIIVSSLISKSYPFKLISEIVLNSKAELCLSSEVLDEYLEVLLRKKFLKFTNFTDNTTLILNYIQKYSSLYYPNKKVDLLKDKSDNKFLELAYVSSADFLITGNFNDFNLKEFHTTKIVSAKEFYSMF